ncbi:MAG: 4Fe-4S binding protein [Candidatus Thorarchaeota archaeon]
MSDTENEAGTEEEYMSIWDRIGRPLARWKRTLLEKSRPHKTLHYWVKKAFEELLVIRIIRFIVQLAAFLVLFYAGIVFVLGYDPLMGTIFSGVAWFIPIFGYIPMPFDMPQGTAQGTATGYFDLIQFIGQQGIFPYIAVGVILIVPILVGRSFCGWICPFGFVQDLLALTPIRKRYPSKQWDQRLKSIKYVILFVVLFLVAWLGTWTFLGNIGAITPELAENLKNAVGLPFATAFWTTINPSSTFFVILPYLYLNGIVSPILTEWNPPFLAWGLQMYIRLGFLIIILLVALFMTRPYCRYLCPAGAMMGLVSQFGFLTVSRSATECLGPTCDSPRCKQACPVGIDVMAKPFGPIHDPECILCLDCVAKCSHDAVKADYG